jgi:hypothetical protein
LWIESCAASDEQLSHRIETHLRQDREDKGAHYRRVFEEVKTMFEVCREFGQKLAIFAFPLSAPSFYSKPRTLR